MAIHDFRAETSASKTAEQLSDSHVQIVEDLDSDEASRSQCKVSL